MKRIGGLFESIASFENLYQAYQRARRGKKSRASIDRFAFDLEPELLRLRRELLEGTYRPGEFVTFTIHDPKTREIAAAPFRDRVLHQAILGVLEPHLEPTLDADSYACRKGLGMDAALRRAQAVTRRSSWVLKSDIKSCFPSVDHAVLTRTSHQIPTAGRKRGCGLRLCSRFDPRGARSTPAVESLRTPCHSAAYNSSLRNLVRSPG